MRLTAVVQQFVLGRGRAGGAAQAIYLDLEIEVCAPILWKKKWDEAGGGGGGG